MFTAACVIIRRRNAVLAVSRKTDSADFGLPGGKIDPGETAEEGACREVFEETGVVLDPSDLRLVYQAAAGKHVCACYVADRWSGTPRSVEAGVVRWLDPAELQRGGTFVDFNRGAFAALAG